MSRLTNSVKLIHLLRKNKIMQSIDFAEQIGCTQRMIRKHDFKYVNNFENAYVKIKCKFPELE